MRLARFHLWVAFLGTIFLIVPLRNSASALDPVARRAEEQSIVVPDGTQIELRFAQDVYGQAVKKSTLPVHVPGEVQRGDTVDLVSVADVRIGARVVLAKGALAQATVVDVVAPIISGRQQTSETGLFLHLDWLRSITGAEIPLRAFKKGGSDRFHVKVISDSKGVRVIPDKLTPFLSRMAAANEEDEDSAKRRTSQREMQQDKEQKNWIPVGATITSFVQGAFPLNADEVEQALAKLPKPNLGAVLSIYRGQDHKSLQRSVSCDGQ